MSKLFTLARRAVPLAVALVLPGCATFSPDGGRDAVYRLVAERIGRQIDVSGAAAERPASALRDLLSKPLGVDGAVSVALQNNPAVKVALGGVATSEADLVQAGRLTNPRFSFGNRRNNETVSIDRTVLFNVMAMLTMPLAQRVAGRQFESAQMQAAGEVLQLVIDTRQAWFAAVAAQQTATYFEQAKVAAEASAELTDKMTSVGNFSKLAQMREQAFLAETTTQLAKARLASITARERLTGYLGVRSGDARFELPERLPDLPAAPIESADAEQSALDRRLDVLVAKRSAEATASNLGLVTTTGFINVLEAGFSNESNTGERRMNGYEVEVQLPLFDWGDAKVGRARAVYMQAVARAAQTAAKAQSEVREAHAAYRTAYDVARRYRDETVPLRKRIANENLLRYNGMLISVFELLADAREQISSVNAAIEALRDFWIADAELQLAQSGRSGISETLRPSATSQTSGGGAAR
jgi:outer membrane protein TolC